MKTIRVGAAPRALATDIEHGTVLVGGWDDYITVLDARSARILYKIGPIDTPLHLMAVSAATGHAFFVSGIGKHYIYTVDLANGQVINSVSLDHHPSAISIDERQRRVFVSSVDSNSMGRIAAIDPCTGAVVFTSLVGLNLVSTAVDERTGRVFVSSTDEQLVRVLDSRTGQLISSVDVGYAPLALVVSRTRQVVYAVISLQEIYLLDAADGAVLDVIKLRDTLGIDGGELWFFHFHHPVAIDDAERLWLVSGSKQDASSLSNGTVTILDTIRRSAVRVAAGVGPSEIILNLDTRRAYVVNTNVDVTHHSFGRPMGAGSVSVFDINTNLLVSTVEVGRFPIAIASVPGTERVFVANSHDDTVSVFEA